MKVLQVHNRYRQRGGEDLVVEQERALLSTRHEVIPWEKENETELKGLWSKLRLPFRTHYSTRSKREAAQWIDDYQPDILHAHNTFPLFTPSIFDAAREAGVPTVMTLHNYRLLHPNGLLLHDGRLDERPVWGSAWQTVRDGVYRNSMLQTAVVAHMIEHHRKRGTWHRVPDLFIVLTEFAKAKLAEGGIPEEKMLVKPNFLEDPLEPLSPKETRIDGSENGNRETKEPIFLFVGRMSEEKGVEDLIEAWIRHRPEATLRLMGDGPARAHLQRRSEGVPRIEWLGARSHDEVLLELQGARALLFPSRWYEGFPMTLLEAFACGCPVIVTEIGSQGEIIQEGETGLKVPARDPDAIAEKVNRLANQPEWASEMGTRARHIYEENYRPEQNLQMLETIYEAAADCSRS